jgi:ribosomal protein L20
VLQRTIKRELSADSRTIWALIGALSFALGAMTWAYLHERALHRRFMAAYIKRQNAAARHG